MNEIQAIIAQAAVLLFSIIFHEVSHGWAALTRGDTTARDAGRLTLNPIPHIDLFGTVIFPGILIAAGSPVLFGWAKPVPMDPGKMKNPRRDMAVTGASGPLSNILLAVAAGALFRAAAPLLGTGSGLVRILYFAVFINLVLAVFNLIPIPPLDGSRILMGILPPRAAEQYSKLERFGFGLVFLLFFLGFFRAVVFPAVRLLTALVTGT